MIFYLSRNNLIKVLYKLIAKPFFFLCDPETIHDQITILGNLLGKYNITKKLTALFFNYSNPILQQNIAGINFKNPIGLAAGFDKNAELTEILPKVGFGFMEVGSITGEACEGNPKPRLWRLIKENSLIVNYGLKNQGAEILSKKLSKMKFEFPIGVSIAKTNCLNTANTKDGIKDYLKAYNLCKNFGDYITINISCPNAYGGQPFTDPAKLELLLNEISTNQNSKPIFLKLSPDMNFDNLDQIIEICDNYKIAGFICNNLTKKNKLQGGQSGKPLKEISLNFIRYIYQKTDGKYIIIGCGGVFSGQDAYDKIKAGASLIQLITGMIFEGPQLISQINIELSKLLMKDGFQNISQAIGADLKKITN